MALLMQQRNDNKELFKNLLTELSSRLRPNYSLDALFQFLDDNKFFIQPASTQYKYSYEGGLCQHSLVVCKLLVDLYKSSNIRTINVTKDSIYLVALFHDIYKMFSYTQYNANIKKYSSEGNKVDELGRYSWVTELRYKLIPVNERKLAVGKGCETSYFIANSFFDLYIEEASAILNQSVYSNDVATNNDIAGIFSSNPLAVLLHCADMMSTYLDDTMLNTKYKLEDFKLE